jgi:hypothetical protein
MSEYSIEFLQTFGNQLTINYDPMFLGKKYYAAILISSEHNH